MSGSKHRARVCTLSLFRVSCMGRKERRSGSWDAPLEEGADTGYVREGSLAQLQNDAIQELGTWFE